jgi:hypothetical protein
VRARVLLMFLVQWPLAPVVLLGGSGCEPVRELVLAPVLPTPCVTMPVNELRVRGLGDFPPSSGEVGAMEGATLDLPRGTRVVTVEGMGQGGLAAFGRTAPLDLPGAWDAGGEGHRVPLAYGPPDTFCATGSLRYARRDHRATLLADGSVLISGGVDMNSGPVLALERYLPGGDDSQPLAGFVAVDASLSDRSVRGHGATVLADGRVLISGGAPTADGEGAFEGALLLAADGAAGAPSQIIAGGPRAFHSATLLPDGRVLLAGGCAVVEGTRCAPGQTLSSTAIYDPASNSWSTGLALLAARAGHQAIVRDDGLIVLVGGQGEGGVVLSPELFDPTESRGSSIAGPSGTAVALPSGLVVALNDAAGATQRTLAWSARDEAPALLPQLSAERAGATLTALEDGAVLVAGGTSGSTLAATSVILRADGPSEEVAGLPASGHSATLLRDGTVLIAGGQDSSGHASAQAAVFLRSLSGPFDTPSTITFDGGAGLVPSRPAIAVTSDGALRLDGGDGASRSVDAMALLCGPSWAGPSAAGFDLFVLAGRQGDAEAAIVFGDPRNARYVALSFAAGTAPRLWSARRDRPGLVAVEEVAGCDGIALSGEELPEGGFAAFTLRARDGHLVLSSAGRQLLDCPVDDRVPLRGSIALGAVRGVVRWDNLQVDR